MKRLITLLLICISNISYAQKLELSKTEYSPGDYIKIQGSGFTKNTSFSYQNILVIRNDKIIGSTSGYQLTSNDNTTDGNGNFTSAFLFGDEFGAYSNEKSRKITIQFEINKVKKEISFTLFNRPFIEFYDDTNINNRFDGYLTASVGPLGFYFYTNYLIGYDDEEYLIKINGNSVLNANAEMKFRSIGRYKEFQIEGDVKNKFKEGLNTLSLTQIKSGEKFEGTFTVGTPYETGIYTSKRQYLTGEEIDIKLLNFNPNGRVQISIEGPDFKIGTNQLLIDRGLGEILDRFGRYYLPNDYSSLQKNNKLKIGKYKVTIKELKYKTIYESEFEIVSTVVQFTSIFSYTPTSPQTNQSITFKDESTGSPTTWVWDFGDGTTSNVQNPTKIYSKAGTYNVKLTVSKVGATPVFSTKEIIVIAVSTNAGTLSVVAQSQNSIPVDGGNITLSVTSNIDWQLTSNATWLKPSITGGSGNGTVTLTAENNTLTNDRTAKITFTGKNVASVEITVNQNKVGLTTATSAPFNLLAKTTSPTTIGLSWEQKGNLPSTKFLIEQEQSNGSFKEIGRTTNSLPAYSIDGLTPNNTYCFRVKTLLNQLESLPSNKACATTKINNFKRGVTVVTHGFQLFGNGFSVLSDGKVEDFVMGDSKQVGMCAAIKKRIEDEGGNATIYRNNSNTSKWVKVTGEGKITDEVILFYNWSAVSNDTFDGALEAAADNLFAMLARPKVEGKGGITDNLFDSDLPFHFIAHSRGNIVLLQVLHRMLKYFPNKKIEHFTLLDPHPATTMNDINLKTENQSLPGIYGLPSKYPDEPSLKLPLNVLKADVYYRQVFYYENIKIYDFTNNLTDFSGIPVSNTPNNVLFENNLIENGATPFLVGFVFKLAHVGIHEWYKGTIVPNDPIFQQGGRKDWYAVLPRNLYGYNNSRVGNNSNKFTNVSNGIDSTEMNSRIIARTGKSLNPIFNGNFQYVLDGLKSLTKKNALYGYYFNGGKSVETKLISPLSGIQKGKYVLSNPITSSPFVLTHSNFYFPKTYKYLKITVDDFDFNCKLKVDFYNTLDSINSVGGAGIILKEGIKNYYAPIPQSLVGDIGRFTLSSQNKYLISNSLFTDIDISNVELVVGKSPNGGRQITEQQIIIFPNPTMDKITVDLSEIEDNIESIILKDAQGNDIKEIPISIDGKLIQLNLKSYRVGIYYIQVNTSESVITKKIILNQE